MFKWLERRAAKQSLFNVRINAQTLIAVANRADAAIARTATTNPSVIKAVASAQRSLLTDIQLALANGASLSDVEQKITEAKSKEPAVSAGAEKALRHVLNHVATSRENYKRSTEHEEIVRGYGAYLGSKPTSGQPSESADREWAIETFRKRAAEIRSSDSAAQFAFALGLATDWKGFIAVQGSPAQFAQLSRDEQIDYYKKRLAFAASVSQADAMPIEMVNLYLESIINRDEEFELEAAEFLDSHAKKVWGMV